MSYQQINAALSKHLQSFGEPVEYENKSFKPVVGTLYLRELFMPATLEQPSVAHEGTKDYTGLYQIDVMAPRGEGKLTAYDVAGRLATHFGRGVRVSYQGVTVEINDPPSQGPTFNVDDRFILPVTVRWRALV